MTIKNFIYGIFIIISLLLGKGINTNDKNLVKEPETVEEDYGVFFLTNGTRVYYAKTDTSAVTDLLHYGDQITQRAVARDGYTFRGWFYSGAQNTEFKETTMPANNVSVVALWNPIAYQVVFNGNGGETTSHQTSQSVECIYDVTQSAPSATLFKKTHYEMIGWSSIQNGGVAITPEGEFSNLTTTASDIVNLYAVWQLSSCDVTLNPCGGITYNGSASSSTVTIDAGSNILTSINELNPSRTGYTFDGWYYDAEYSQAVGENDIISQEFITLYAKWTAIDYTITWDPNGGYFI